MQTPNRLVYKDFPVQLRQPYEEISQVREWDRFHSGLLDFVELSLTYLASMALSDYRSRAERPEPKVEMLLERSSSALTLGRVLELMRTCAAAIENPIIPPLKGFPRSELSGLSRFVAASKAIEEAVAGQSAESRPASIEVGYHVDRALDRTVKSIGWWQGWELVVNYRNKVTHSNSSRWPARGERFCEVMAPLLHDAIIDLITEQRVSEAVLEHPVVNLTLIGRNDSGGHSHHVCGEDRGIWFEEEIVISTPITDRWPQTPLEPNATSSYLLDRNADGWTFRGAFWDLRTGPPPPIEPVGPERPPSLAENPPTAETRSGAGSTTEVLMEGSGVAPGTCGEFAQGVLPDGTPFHVTCPINKSSTVRVRLRPSTDLTVEGLGERHRKLGLAVENAIRLFDLGAVEASVQHWSDLDVGKGMGSSTADVLAGIRAVAAAAGKALSPELEGTLAAGIESSDGSMYPGLAAVNHRTCELIRAWDWFPEFVIVMLVPHDNVDTPSISFSGQDQLASEYEDLLERMDAAVQARSAADFAAQSTRSAVLNGRFLLNPYCRTLCEKLEEFGALGLNVGHTGTVCGLLFENSDDGRQRASEACFEVRRRFPDLKDVKVATTPYCAVQ
jgi:L-threonine kinase